MNHDDTASRRAFLRNGLVLAAAGMAFASAARAQDQKIDQALVQYQKMPKDGAKCSGCVNFEAPNACKIVAGTIDPDGWCVAYAPKDG